MNAPPKAASSASAQVRAIPELLTLKAVRALGEADVLAHFAKRGNNGNARATVAGLPQARRRSNCRCSIR